MGTSQSVDLLIEGEFQETAFNLRDDARIIDTFTNDIYGSSQLLTFAESISSKPFVLKQRLCSSKEEFTAFIAEPKKRKSAQNAHVIAMKEVFVCKQEDILNSFFKVYMTYDYYETSLREIILEHVRLDQSFSQSTILQLLESICCAIIFFCENGIAHRYVKPSAIAVDIHNTAVEDTNKRIKNFLLSDVGFLFNGDTLVATLQAEDTPDLSCYLSPEEFEEVRNASIPSFKGIQKVIDGIAKSREAEESNRNFYSTKNAAVFSLGMIALEMATLKSSSELYDFGQYCLNKTRLMSRLEKVAASYSPSLAHLIGSMLHFSPEKRISVESLLISVKEYAMEAAIAAQLAQSPQSGGRVSSFRSGANTINKQRVSFDPKMIFSNTHNSSMNEHTNFNLFQEEDDIVAVKQHRSASKYKSMNEVMNGKSKQSSENGGDDDESATAISPQTIEYKITLEEPNVKSKSKDVHTKQRQQQLSQSVSPILNSGKSVHFETENVMPHTHTTDFYLSPPNASKVTSPNQRDQLSRSYATGPFYSVNGTPDPKSSIMIRKEGNFTESMPYSEQYSQIIYKQQKVKQYQVKHNSKGLIPSDEYESVEFKIHPLSSQIHSSSSYGSSSNTKSKSVQTQHSQSEWQQQQVPAFSNSTPKSQIQQQQQQQITVGLSSGKSPNGFLSPISSVQKNNLAHSYHSNQNRNNSFTCNNNEQNLVVVVEKQKWSKNNQKSDTEISSDSRNSCWRETEMTDCAEHDERDFKSISVPALFRSSSPTNQIIKEKKVFSETNSQPQQIPILTLPIRSAAMQVKEIFHLNDTRNQRVGENRLLDQPNMFIQDQWKDSPLIQPFDATSIRSTRTPQQPYVDKNKDNQNDNRGNPKNNNNQEQSQRLSYSPNNQNHQREMSENRSNSGFQSEKTRNQFNSREAGNEIEQVQYQQQQSNRQQEQWIKSPESSTRSPYISSHSIHPSKLASAITTTTQLANKSQTVNHASTRNNNKSSIIVFSAADQQNNLYAQSNNIPFTMKDTPAFNPIQVSNTGNNTTLSTIPCLEQDDMPGKYFLQESSSKFKKPKNNNNFTVGSRQTQTSEQSGSPTGALSLMNQSYDVSSKKSPKIIQNSNKLSNSQILNKQSLLMSIADQQNRRVNSKSSINSNEGALKVQQKSSNVNASRGYHQKHTQKYIDNFITTGNHSTQQSGKQNMSKEGSQMYLSSLLEISENNTNRIIESEKQQEEEDENSLKEQKFQELPTFSRLTSYQQYNVKGKHDGGSDQELQISERNTRMIGNNKQLSLQDQINSLEEKLNQFDILLVQQKVKAHMILDKSKNLK